MKYINNFSSHTHTQDTPLFDVLVWIAGLVAAKRLDYRTKLYCTHNDLHWLKEWGLLDYYDELDVDFLENEANYPNVDRNNFWSVRKLMCINHEFNITTDSFLFADTDVILFSALRLDTCDCAAWSPDPKNLVAPIYCDWSYLSNPPGYVLPDYVKETSEAYNAGILYFKNYFVFQQYYKQYLAWTEENPCILSNEVRPDSAITMRNVWACNAEQRLLAAVALHNKWRVGTVLPYADAGIGELGAHYYVFRAVWRRMRDPEYTARFEEKERDFYKAVYKSHLVAIWQAIPETYQDKFLRVPWFRELVENGVDPLPY